MAAQLGSGERAAVGLLGYKLGSTPAQQRGTDLYPHVWTLAKAGAPTQQLTGVALGFCDLRLSVLQLQGIVPALIFRKMPRK